jgi:hypothetical protein
MRGRNAIKASDMKNEHIALRISISALKDIDDLAIKYEMSRGALIRFALSSFITREKLK